MDGEGVVSSSINQTKATLLLAPSFWALRGPFIDGAFGALGKVRSKPLEGGIVNFTR